MTKDATMQKLTGAAFTAALSARGLSQADFARMTGTHKTTVSRWASGAAMVAPWVPSWMELSRPERYPEWFVEAMGRVADRICEMTSDGPAVDRSETDRCGELIATAIRNVLRN
jgi:hypothetical protein